MPKKQVLRRVIGTLVLIGAGLSPFAFYIGLRLTEPAAVLTWPGDVAVVTSDGDSLQSLALIHFLDNRPMIVRFPVETSLSVPAAGTLRAQTAYGIGGTTMLARALQETLGVAVPFWAEWRRDATAGRPPDRTNLGDHTETIVAIIASTQARVVTAPGRFDTQSGLSYYVLDHRQLALILRGMQPSPSASASPFASASPAPSSAPAAPAASVSIEVLNQGGEAGAATDVASRLQNAGYIEIRVGNSTRRAISGVTVYYTGDRAAALEVARVIGDTVTSVAPLPDGITTTADILVLVGRSPSSPRTSSPRQTASPSPSESDVVVP